MNGMGKIFCGIFIYKFTQKKSTIPSGKINTSPMDPTSRNPLLAHDFRGDRGTDPFYGRAPSPLRLWLSSLFESPHPNTTMSPDRATARCFTLGKYWLFNGLVFPQDRILRVKANNSWLGSKIQSKKTVFPETTILTYLKKRFFDPKGTVIGIPPRTCKIGPCFFTNKQHKKHQETRNHINQPALAG